jgi:uncharacterized protein YlxW (UPF0749 family)
MSERISSGPRPQSPDMLTELFRSPLDPGYADAARRRPVGAPARRWAGAARIVVLAVVGFLLAVAYHQVVERAPGQDQTRADLASQVAGRRADAERLQRDADRLRDEVSRRRDQALPADPELLRLRDLEARTGLGRVRGNGAVIMLSDAPDAIDPVTGAIDNNNPGRVLDSDLQQVANVLWQAGAEAIAINGERLTATSTIRSAGSAILVNYRPLTRPYEVAAIGPVGLDRSLLNSSTGRDLRRLADRHRMRFEVDARAGLVLPAGADPGLRYAHPPELPPAASPTSSSGGPSASATPSRGAR